MNTYSLEANVVCTVCGTDSGEFSLIFIRDNAGHDRIDIICNHCNEIIYSVTPYSLTIPERSDNI